MLSALYGIAYTNYRFYEFVHSHALSEEALRVAELVVVVLMKRYVIHAVVGYVEAGILPLAKGFHMVVGAAANYGFD